MTGTLSATTTFAFDAAGPLPTGTTVLEASAGTGKTHAIVGLAVRYVAEAGIPLSQLLLVTFSRAATLELRERTRDRFVSVATALASPEQARDNADEVVALLADADPATVRLRRHRLLTALAEFDAGTIATTHSFCQRMLDELGIAGEHDPRARLVESVDDVVATVVDDLYLARYARLGVGERPPVSLRDAHAIALAAVGDPHAELAPRTDGAIGERVSFATAVRAETERRKRRDGLRDFDDLLVLLHAVLADPVHGARARARIQARYQVALVDEFQDTDPLQWDILRLAFRDAATLVLVGDPKQAIYAFRGAEVLSYLDAVRVAGTRRELTRNWRSDAGLLRALDHVYGGAELGHPDIAVYPITATRGESRLRGPAEVITPLRLRVLPNQGAARGKKYPTVGVQRAAVAADLAADLVTLLESGTLIEVDPRRAAGQPLTDLGDGRVGRPVSPGDIAVLVRTRTQLDIVRAALDQVGVASVLAGGTSVFSTASATDWLWVLRALEQPHRGDRVRLAATTPLLGYTLADLDAGGADLVGRISTRLRDAARLFARAGFASMFDDLATATDLAPRLLARDNGERDLTDLRHVAQLLDEAAHTESMGLTALTRWLADRVRKPETGSVASRSRRLDRDAEAVQIATVHASKGLEFPLVYLPFAWDSAKNPYPATLLFHDDNGTRVLDIGGKEAPGYAERKARSEAEEAGEELRLLYVALTRAMCQVVAWWAPSASTRTAPLHRLLLGRRPGEGAVARTADVPSDTALLRALTDWAAPVADVVSVKPVELGGEVAVAPRRLRTEPTTGDLAAAIFDRPIDHQWRRTSYSALTASAHDTVGVVDSEPEEGPGPDDEPTEVPLTPPAPVTTEAAPSLMNALPYGAEFGTLVHSVLETVDTSVDDLGAEVRARCVDAVAHTMADLDIDVLAHALTEVLRTPTDFGSLAAIPTRDRLNELEFELPLGGGETPGPSAGVHAIATLLREHLPADDDLVTYPAHVAALPDTALRGFLTGSIDAVLRVPDAVGGQRFLIVDYKTNRLGAGDLTVDHYRREHLIAEMIRSHYPLQALLYSVALHRYLRWRLPGYDPAKHLGGARYLFVRGMVGPSTPAGVGSFDWQPSAELVVALSDLLAGESR
ncbi:UvrD-helicase domain-containing protein [Nocardia camponoti]|uniref:RecBCD enzyme subunit RecB n=1 Tax=Nocardia camponoti TaxID=1616106 RepID=A0A917Q9Y9_9NOCA|nr:UvrD-helicase domain-containing protein [Nocardia camponoti]GGK38067.1 RecBCD enzyme subunit RecB [Nocardia camponoti]